VTQMVSAGCAAALRNKCLNLAKTCRSGSGPASERTSQSRQLMSAFGAKRLRHLHNGSVRRTMDQAVNSQHFWSSVSP